MSKLATLFCFLLLQSFAPSLAAVDQEKGYTRVNTRDWMTFQIILLKLKPSAEQHEKRLNCNYVYCRCLGTEQKFIVCSNPGVFLDSVTLNIIYDAIKGLENKINGVTQILYGPKKNMMLWKSRES